MDEGGYVKTGRREPDPAGAMHALDLALEMLEEAKIRLEGHDLQSALDESRDAMRLASSALLFRDGYVTNDFDRTVVYLRQNYDDRLPLREWERMEVTYLGDGGVYNMIMRAMGKVKKSDDDIVKEAIGIAETFITKAKKELES